MSELKVLEIKAIINTRGYRQQKEKTKKKTIKIPK